MKYYLGIDLGGTNVRVARISEVGEVLDVVKAPSHSKESAQVIEENIINLIKQVKYDDVEAIGICVPGPVNTITNTMTMATNIPALKEYPLCASIEKATGKKVFMDNDANAAGLAEAVVGAGKGKRIVYYFTHSTGIGGALVVGGKVVSGKNGYAGEIGNIIVRQNAKKVNHLNAGSVENWASGTGMALNAKEKGMGDISAREIFELYKNNDSKAVEVVNEMAKDLAIMMSSISHVCDPDCYVIGGGVSNCHEYYFDKVSSYLNELVHEGMRNVPIYKASLEEPGIIGAAMVARSNIE